jgi:pimeloyl-ACP methyl ester carboxylesterase
MNRIEQPGPQQRVPLHRLARARRALMMSLLALVTLALLGTTPSSAAPTSAAAPAGRAAAAPEVGLAARVTTQPTLAHPRGRKPTVVLVHGAFADASGWNGVTSRLQRKGYTVIAPANPLRSVQGDAAYLASVLATIDGPIVLVGHSYGGEVITNAATGNPNVKALVYVAAFAPDEGETSGELAMKYPGSQLVPENLVLRPYPISATQTGLDGYIKPTKFREIFCADLSRTKAAVMAASQRPGSLNTLSEKSGPPAWKTIPSWYLVAKQDRAIPPASERFMAKRMKAHTREINSSHVAMTSHPTITTRLIIDADRGTR